MVTFMHSAIRSLELRFRWLGIVAMMALASCSTSGERRWFYASYQPEQPAALDADGKLSVEYRPRISMTSYATPESLQAPSASTNAQGTDKKPLSLKDLSDRGQGSVIDGVKQLMLAAGTDCGDTAQPPSGTALARSGAVQPKPKCGVSAFLRALNLTSDAPDSEKLPSTLGSLDATSFNRTVVVNVLNGPDLAPGDRLQQYTITVKLNHNYSFSGYTIAQTQSNNAVLGSILQTTQLNLSAKLDPSFAGRVEGSGEASAGYSNTKAVNSNINEAVIPLNVNIQGDTLYIQKRGGSTADITGNTVIALTLARPPDDQHAALVVKREKLFGDDGAALSPEKAVLAVDFTRFPDDHKDVTAKVSLDFLLRHVNHGASTYAEGNDWITFFHGPLVERDSVLIPKGEILGEKWVIVAEVDDQWCELTGAPSELPNDNYPLYFKGQLDAYTFVTWLKAGPNKPSVNAGQLKFAVNRKPVDQRVASSIRPMLRTAWNNIASSESAYCKPLANPS